MRLDDTWPAIFTNHLAVLEQDFQETYHLNLREVIQRDVWHRFKKLAQGLTTTQPHVYIGGEKPLIVPSTRIGRLLKG